MKRDFIACNALIYNEDRDLIANAKVLDYDSYENSIMIKNIPALDNINRCEVVILTAPTPYVYKGTIYKTAINKAESGKRINLYNENRTDNRKEVRYKINSSAAIDELIYDDKAYHMHTRIEVQLINISKGGARFRSKPNAFVIGNRFHIQIQNGEMSTQLLAEVVNAYSASSEYFEYGCRFIDVDGDRS